jgi:hypothetical protein
LNFHSCQGVKTSNLLQTDFRDNEYVVYDTEQVRMDYLIQYQCSLPDVAATSTITTTTTTTTAPTTATNQQVAHHTPLHSAVESIRQLHSDRRDEQLQQSVGSITEQSWLQHLAGDFDKQYFVRLVQFLSTERQQHLVYPQVDHTFAALNLCALPSVRVVILGQDPYVGAAQANGLAFSDPYSIPPSLANIFVELRNDLGLQCTHGDLRPWAKQGVLLLNTCLTGELLTISCKRLAYGV